MEEDANENTESNVALARLRNIGMHLDMIRNLYRITYDHELISVSDSTLVFLTLMIITDDHMSRILLMSKNPNEVLGAVANANINIFWEMYKEKMTEYDEFLKMPELRKGEPSVVKYASEMILPQDITIEQLVGCIRMRARINNQFYKKEYKECDTSKNELLREQWISMTCRSRAKFLEY